MYHVSCSSGTSGQTVLCGINIPKAAIIKTSRINLATMLPFPRNLLLTTRLALIR